ncbi:MAG: L-lactate dehydrogenase, partial [Exiguobacterium sp.]|nr:L-lactate dehydrogenase [Exiguobacterium sp.]
KAVLRNENTLLIVGAHLDGEYGLHDIHIGVPAIINRQGVREVVEIELSQEEHEKMQHSANVLMKTMEPVL